MVFSSVVASLINKFLSPFVDELTSNQLNVFAWSGKVSLTDVSVKPNAFDSLKLPFRVIHGHIGRIEASVPWMNIYTEPIVIKISDVYVVSIPNSEIKYDEEEEKKYEWNIKKAYLENIELMKQKIKDEAGAKNEDDGFVMKLIVAAVKNVQIFINNVHVCYEDSSSYRNNVFQIGLSFSSLIFETETNKTNVKYTNDQIIHKLVKLEGFSIYLNSKKVKRYNGLKFSDINNRLKSHISKDPKGDSHLEYILCPINFISEATIHRKPEIDSYKIPIIDLVMNLESFYLQVTNYQIHTLLLLLDSIERMRSAAPYRKWRPSVSIKRNPLLWWKFIYTSIVETGVRRKKREFSWQSIHDIGRKRKIYTELYRRKLLGENVTNLEDYEKDLNLITIVMARSRAEMDTKEILDARKEKAKRGWLSGWWSSSAPKNNEVIKDIKEEFTSEEKDKLYKAIGYDENSLLQLYPPEFIAHRLSFKINLFKILVQREKDILMDIEFNHSKIEFFNRPSSGNIFLKNELDSLTIIGANNVVLLKGKEKQELLKFKFEMNPLDKQFDFSVDLKMKSSYILYDIDTINHLYLLFKPPKNIMEEIQSYAHDKFDNLKQMTALGLEYAVEKHKQMKLNIDVDPSFVIVPKLAQISNASTVLLLSLGKFLLTSKLVPKSNVPKVKDMIGLGETAVMEEMMKLIYEKYTCHIQNVQVILSDNENWKADINNLDTERHMLYPFELTLNISRSIIPQDPHFAKLIIYGELPVIDMRASDAQISLLLALIVSLPFGPTINEFTITNDDSIDSIAGRSYTAVKTVNMPKLNVLNDEVTDAFMYATKNLEKVEEPKSKQSEVDGIDSSKAKSNNSSTSLVVYKDLIFEFKLKDIFLTIFQLDRLHESSLAKFHLDKFSLYGEMLTDNTLWMNCSVSDLIVYDIRYGRKEGGIRTILKKSRNAGDESKSILTIYIAQKIAERIIVINMSRFSFILALDYMMAVIDTSTKAFVIQEDVVGRSLERISSSEKTVQRNQKQPTKGSNVINIIEFDLSKMEVFILESLDLDRQVAEACAFTCFSKINIRVEPTEVIIKGEVSKIMMALVDYLEYINKDDVKAYIMAPIDLTINGSIKDKKQVIDLNFSDINITISPHMVSIILSILSTMGSTTKVASSEIEQKDSSISMINYMKPIDRKVWYLNCTPMANEALDLIKPNVVVENLMTFSMNSIKILINSSGLMSQPLIRFSMTNHAKLSQNKNFVFKGSLAADYFNNSLNTWEPLIEPINNEPLPLQGEIDLDETCKKISIETKQNLELLLTKSSINSLYVTNNAFQSAFAVSKSFEKAQFNRVIIRNYLGIDIDLKLSESSVFPFQYNATGSNRTSSSTLVSKHAVSLKNVPIKNGEEIIFGTEEMSRVDISVNLLFSDSIVIARKLICKNKSLRAYFTSIKSYPTNEYWKWIVQINDIGSNAKEITFRSNTQIVNMFNCPFNLYTYDMNNSKLIGKIEPSSTYYLPLKLVYGEELLYIRPSEEFAISDLPVDWRSIDLSEEVVGSESCIEHICNPSASHKSSKKYLVLTCPKKKEASHQFKIKVRGERFNVLYEDTERLDFEDSYIYNIRFIPFVRLKNLLPYSIMYFYEPVQNVQVKLEPGDETNLPFAQFGTSRISYQVLDYLGYDWIASEVLPQSGRENENHYYEFRKIVNFDEQICLAVNYSVEKSSLVLSLFSPYWMMNLTNRDLTYKIDDKHVFTHPKNLNQPLLFCADPSKVSKKDKCSLAISDSKFSDYFPLNVAPYSGSLLPEAKSKRFRYCVNVRTELARVGISKIISFTSFYSIYNISQQNIEYSENNEDWEMVKTNGSKAFFPTRSSNQTLRFRFTDCDTCSKEILLASSSQTLLKLGNDKCLFVEVDVTEFEGTIKISDYFDGAAPVLIVNDLDSEILYGQKGVVVWDKRSNDVLNAKHMVLFCWTEPKEEREFVFKLHEDDEEQSISLDYDQYVKINDNCGWVTFFDGKQRVLIFTADENLPKHLLRTDEITKPKLTFEIIMKGLGINIIDNEKKKDFLYLTINSTSTWEERKGETKHFKELSIKENNILEELYQSHKLSLSNNDSNSIKRMEGYEIDFSKMIMLRPRLSFLRRASNRGMWFLYSSSDHIKQYHMKINRIQIDNQLPDHIFDVAFSPVIVPKSVYNSYELQQKSFIEISAIIQSLGSVTRYKYLQILIQEFMIQLDWGWICHIMNLFNIEASKEETTKTLMAKDLENIFKDRTLEIVQKFVMRKTYYDYLLLGPLKAHLSVTVGDLPDGKFPFGFDFIIRFTGQTIGEINDTLFKLDYFERKMVFLGDSDLQAQIIDHYKTQIFMQFYKLILGLDIIGNPMKLVLGFKKGVGDFFYEPAMGIIHGPEEFAEGIATGVKSLATNVIGGTAGALGRIGNRLGTGVAALTIDEKFQKDRRERINRKVGFAESGRTLFRGFYNGLTGVITKPIEGAQKDGVEGLFKGVGRGVVGIFAQPAASVIDFASGSLQAFNNVIDPKQVAQPIRPARNFRSGRQISPYVLQSAIGNEILRTLSEGKYINEEYEFHVQLNSSSLILLTKMKLLSLKKTVLSNVWDTEWIENWSNCERVERMNGKLRITIKDSKKTLLLFSGAKDRIISTTNDDHIKLLYSNINRHIKPENSDENNGERKMAIENIDR